jgi:hypothetical protein
MSAPSEIVQPAPQDVLPVIENAKGPVAPGLEVVAQPPGEAVAPAVDVPDDIRSERLTLAAAAVVRSPPRMFGVGALAVSALAGAAASLGLFLTFGLPHGRWERPVGDGVYGEVASHAQSTDPSLSFASAVIDIRSAAVAVPGIFSSEPTEDPAPVGEVLGEGEGEVEQAAFSSLVLGTPFETDDLVVEGLVAAPASSVVPADGDLEHTVGGEDEASSPPVSFGSAQLAGALDAPNSSGAGAVLDDGFGVIALPPPMTSGKIVVDRLSTGAVDNATDTVITVPAGARKVDAVLHLVTADGRVAHISDLSVVLGDDETRSGTDQRPARKISPRKSSAADAKRAAAPKPAVAVRSPANRTQTTSPLPPRGLFNFDDYGGVKKANSPDGGKRGAAG